MKYYHVNQGIYGTEPMLAVSAINPIEAARKYFYMLAMDDAMVIWPMNGTAATAMIRFGINEWSDMLEYGCFVEDRRAGKLWSVATDKEAILRAKLLPANKPKAKKTAKKKGK